MDVEERPSESSFQKTGGRLMSRETILIVDDDSSVRRVVQMQLSEAGYEVKPAASGEDALRILLESSPKLVITDLRMPDMDGIDLLRRISNEEIETTLIIITAFGSIETAVQAMRLGAYDYITKPIDYDALLLAVHRAMERQNLIDEVRNLRSALDRRYGFENIIGHSKKILSVLELAARVAQHDSTVLIQGETGTGKELLARAIHSNSRRRGNAFVTINCGAIPKDLIEAELFGFSKGAFTGAHASKPGKIEMADGGTLFLDEIGELPLESQVKLLRLLQHWRDRARRYNKSQIDQRAYCSWTNRNLTAMVEDGTFREDLYYRLAVVPLQLPPLRERTGDIPELAEHLFRKAKERHGMQGLRISSSVIPRLSAYRWPGNIRQLRTLLNGCSCFRMAKRSLRAIYLTNFER